MEDLALTIDGVEVKAEPGETILEVARKAAIYIPSLCAHPDLPVSEIQARDVVFRGENSIEGTEAGKEFEGCQLCLVEIEGRDRAHRACVTIAEEAMAVNTNTPQLQECRRDNLNKLLAEHPNACLACPQREGCSLTSCSSSIPEKERCCPKFNNCELQKVAEYIGIGDDVPRYVYRHLPVIEEEPLFIRDYNLCIGCFRCVRVCQDIRGVTALGFVYQDGKAIVGTLNPSAGESGCKFCGACVEVCPTGALRDKVTKSRREEALVPCLYACPAQIDIPRYTRLITEGKFAEATAVIREKVPFPAILGRVCPHPCETECRRGELNEPVAICALKRFAAENDTGLWKENIDRALSSGKRVAIIGSGPAGLTAAYYLARLGHSVTVFEALSKPGGMMRLGIPEYRLPREVLDREIEEIEKSGVEIKTSTRIESPAELFEQGYNAIFLAIGAHQGIKIDIDGEDTSRVHDASELLRIINLGENVKLGERVVVVGGGNAAIDVARTALRLGVKEVRVVYRRTRAEMPASPEEIEEAILEGVGIEFLAAPIKLRSVNSHLTIECIQMKLGSPDGSGRAHPMPIEGSEFNIESDDMILAIGQKVELGSDWELKTGNGNTIEVESSTLTTGRDGIFAGGDAVTGPATVIQAIAMGRKAAGSIDRYLGGAGLIDEKLIELEEVDPWLGRDDGFADWHRGTLPTLPVEQRIQGFQEVVNSLAEEEAIEQARRCLQCDLRLLISPPVLPPEKWLRLEAQNVASVPDMDGVFQISDEEKNVIYIQGTMNLRQGLEEQLDTNPEACYFLYEEEPMYTRRESELLQQFLRQHGQLPVQNAELDDLF